MVAKLDVTFTRSRYGFDKQNCNTGTCWIHSVPVTVHTQSHKKINCCVYIKPSYKCINVCMLLHYSTSLYYLESHMSKLVCVRFNVYITWEVAESKTGFIEEVALLTLHKHFKKTGWENGCNSWQVAQHYHWSLYLAHWPANHTHKKEDLHFEMNLNPLCLKQKTSTKCFMPNTLPIQYMCSGLCTLPKVWFRHPIHKPYF